MLYQQRVIQEVVTQLPKAMRWLSHVIPGWIQAQLLEQALNDGLRKNIAAHELDFFCGKILNITIKDVGIEFSIRYQSLRLKVTKAVVNADLRFSASSYDLLLIATQKLDPDMLFFQRRLEMSGDTVLGLEIKNLLASIELNEQFHPWCARELMRFATIIERHQ